MTSGGINRTKCASRRYSPCLDSIFAKLGPYFDEPLCCTRAVNIHVAVNIAAVYRSFKQLQNVNLLETEWSSAWLQMNRKHYARLSVNTIYSPSLSIQWKMKKGIVKMWLLYCSFLQTSLCTNYTNTHSMNKKYKQTRFIHFNVIKNQPISGSKSQSLSYTSAKISLSVQCHHLFMMLKNFPKQTFDEICSDVTWGNSSKKWLYLLPFLH